MELSFYQTHRQAATILIPPGLSWHCYPPTQAWLPVPQQPGNLSSSTMLSVPCIPALHSSPFSVPHYSRSFSGLGRSPQNVSCYVWPLAFPIVHGQTFINSQSHQCLLSVAFRGLYHLLFILIFVPLTKYLIFFHEDSDDPKKVSAVELLHSGRKEPSF